MNVAVRLPEASVERSGPVHDTICAPSDPSCLMRMVAPAGRPLYDTVIVVVRIPGAKLSYPSSTPDRGTATG